MMAAIVTAFDELAGLETAWWGLVARVPSATPFATPAWLLPWWRTFAPGALSVVTVFEGDQLVGLAPLYVEDGPLGRRLLPMGIGLTDVLDILLDPVHCEPVGKLLGEILAAGRSRYACWSAEEAPPGAAVLAIANPPGWRSLVAPQSACPVLCLRTFGDVRAAIPPHRWRKWQMARNRASRRVWTIEPATRDTLHNGLAHLVRLHGARWQTRGQAGVLADDAVQRFHAAAAPSLLAAGLLRLTVLRIDGNVAGVCHVLCDGRAAYAYLGGFDPAYAFESPGTLLIGAAIEAAVREGLQEFSFLRGQEAYKYEWGAVDRWNRRRVFEPVP